MLSLNLISQNQDNIQVDIDSKMIQLIISPDKPISGDGVHDVMRVALKKRSVKKLLRSIRFNEKYLTETGQAIIWKEDNQFHFRNNVAALNSRHYFTDLGIEDSFTLLGALRWVADDIPPILQPYNNIQDAQVFMILLQGLGNKLAIDDPEYWITLGTVLGSSNHLELSSECFRKALEIEPQNPDARLNLAVNLNIQGKYEKALEEINQVPDGIKRRNLFFGQILRNQGQILDSVDYFEKAINEEPVFWIPYINLFEVLQELNHPSYEVWLEKSINAIPDSPQITWHYCRNLLNQGRLEELEQVDWLDQLETSEGHMDIIGRNEEAPRLIFEAGLCRSIARSFLHNEESELELLAEKIIKADHRWVMCEYAKIILHPLVEMGKIDLITQTYARVCQVCCQEENGIPSYLETLLAHAHQNRGEFENAITQCEIVLNEKPDHLDMLATYWWNLDEIGKLDEAINTAEKLREINPSEDHIYYNLGYLCGKNGQLGKADFYYQQEIDRDPGHFLAIENLSFNLLLEGQIEKSREYFDRFLKLRKPFLLSDDYQNNGDSNDKTIEDNTTLIKEEKFLELIDFAGTNFGSNVYAYKLEKMNKANRPLIGAETAVGKKSYTLEDVLVSLSGHASQAEMADTRFQLEMQKRGDYSSLVYHILQDIPNFERLPEASKDTLLEGEKRLNESEVGDFSLAVIAFSKAVEVSIKQMVLDPFLENYHYEIDAERITQLKLSRKPKGVYKFLLYVERRNFIGLGEMGRTFDICNNPQVSSLVCFSELRDYIVAKLGFTNLLDPSTLEKVTNLARNYRNRAAHAATFKYSDAVEARRLSSEILSTLSTS